MKKNHIELQTGMSKMDRNTYFANFKNIYLLFKWNVKILSKASNDISNFLIELDFFPLKLHAKWLL